MGDGPRNQPDVPKAVPRAASAMGATTSPDQIVDESRGSAEGLVDLPSLALDRPGLTLSAPIDYCERVHILRFATLAGAPPHLHQPIRLRIANPPHVVDIQGASIGELCDPQASAILTCLIGRYVMIGEVITLDADGEHGEVRVSGRLEAEPG
jgi:hypothetical protein